MYFFFSPIHPFLSCSFLRRQFGKVFFDPSCHSLVLRNPSFNAFDRMAKDASPRAGQMILGRLNPRYIGLVTVRVMFQQDMKAYCPEVLFSFLFSFLRLLHSYIRVALKYPLPSVLPITRKFHVAYNILASQKELCGPSRSIVRYLSV